MFQFDVKKLGGLNAKIDNVLRFPLPYWLIRDQGTNLTGDQNKKMVVFFGNDLGGIISFGMTDKDSYILRVNKCLDYIRKRFQGFELCYRPHPGDNSEQALLKLSDFRILEDGLTAEVFLSKNIEKIRAVFTISSFSSFNAYNMGLESHFFYHCFQDIYNPDFTSTLDGSFFELPDSVFIRNFEQDLINNSRILQKDDSLERNFVKILNENQGKVWFYCSFSESIVLLSILARIIRTLSSGRKIGLIVSHHRRWDRIAAYLKENFDEVYFIPRIHYSLKPSRLLNTVRMARRVKNLGILPGDILIVASQPDFVENCIISYYKKNFRIGLMSNRDFNAAYNPQSSNFTDYNSHGFYFNKATWFFNKILEPILGLNRSLYLSFTSMSGFYFNRYQRPVNEIFDRFIIFYTT